MSASPRFVVPGHLDLPDQAATEAVAAAVAAVALPGDVIALSGDLGAGKTAFARAFVSALAAQPVEVPSPTFTLVQTYDLPAGQVWHFDLYRIERPDEAFELGIEDAFAEGISLIEWPDRLGDLLPPEALSLDFAHAGEPSARRLGIAGGAAWQGRLAPVLARGRRQAAIHRFLAAAGWGGADRRPLAGDASFRRYERLRGPAGGAVLMDAPPPQEDIRPFVAVAAELRERGYSAPEILAGDAESGLLLLEDLGDGLYARLLCQGADETALYAAAVDLLADLHRLPPPAALPPYDTGRLLDEAALLIDWYLPARLEGAVPAGLADEYLALWRDQLPAADVGPPVLVLRDYHAENLLWLPDRAGHRRVGLLDFQDAVAGSPAYDLVSLLQDARRDVAPDLAEAMLRRYIAATGAEDAAFRRAFAVLGAQRNAKILGIFTRLWRRDGKPRYLDLLPRVWGLLERDLAHPALAPVKAWFDRNLPPADRRRPLPGA